MNDQQDKVLSKPMDISERLLMQASVIEGGAYTQQAVALLREAAAALSTQPGQDDAMAALGRHARGLAQRAADEEWSNQYFAERVAEAVRESDADTSQAQPVSAPVGADGVVASIRECELFLRTLGLESEPARKVAEDARKALDSLAQQPRQDEVARLVEAARNIEKWVEVRPVQHPYDAFVELKAALAPFAALEATGGES